jgi:hypothetical protein
MFLYSILTKIKYYLVKNIPLKEIFFDLFYNLKKIY